METTKALIKQKGCDAVTFKSIMDHSGLSKGGIFHYVKSKEEIFFWILREQIAETNARFMNEVNSGRKTFGGPMEMIAKGLSTLEDPDNLTNQVLMFLLGKGKDPEVTKVLNQFYGTILEVSRKWIEVGQKHGVIKASVDANTTAEMFVILGFGMRMRSAFAVKKSSFDADVFAKFIAQILKT